MPLNDATIAIKRVESPLERYQSFYDHAWAKELIRRLDNTRVIEPFQNLCVGLKQAANTHQLPWLMAQSLSRYSEAFLREFQPYSQPIFDTITTRLLNMLGDGLSVTKRREIATYIGEIGTEFRTMLPQEGINPYVWWNMAIQQEEFQLSIFGSQNLCFCAQVFAYECFVWDCFIALGGDSCFKTSESRFWKALGDCLGRDCKPDYWDDQPIYVAREVRNCFAHRGGKAKPQLIEALNKIPHIDYRVYASADGDLCVMPTDNWNLFALVKGKVSKLVDEVLPRIGA